MNFCPALDLLQDIKKGGSSDRCCPLGLRLGILHPLQLFLESFHLLAHLIDVFW
jgi:hypothetical protein